MSPPVSQAFAKQLTGLLPALRRYARALCGDPALADDLVQDGIERALTRADTLQQPALMAAWMRRIVHRLYLDELRRRRTRGVSVDVADMANDLALCSEARGGGALSDVAQALRRVSVEHRQVLILAGVEELTYREIADELRVPMGTVMSRLARARAALRAELEQAPPPASAHVEWRT